MQLFEGALSLEDLLRRLVEETTISYAAKKAVFPLSAEPRLKK